MQFHHIQYVLFDMDGVLLDSEPVHHMAKVQLLQQCGIASDIDFSSYVGVANDVFWADMIQRYHIRDTAQNLAVQQLRLTAQSIVSGNLKPSQSLPELLAFLQARRIAMAVVSSSYRTLVKPVLQHLAIGHYFDAVVTGDEVTNVKPSPELYCLALRRLGAQPLQAVAVEDSRLGVQAAVSAGIPCIGYTNPTSGRQDLSAAACTVDSLHQLKQLWEAV